MDIRHKTIDLIDEAVTNGTNKEAACELLGITIRTLQRWEQPNGCSDKRINNNKVPANKLSTAEKHKILEVINSPEYGDLPPSQIVPKLADDGIYLASESSFYRIMQEEKLLQHRGKTKQKSHSKPKALIATAPNQVWSWDISYLPTTVRGVFYYLYLVMDVFSRKIVGWAIHDEENAEYASLLMQDIVRHEKIVHSPLYLHSDNGSVMKASTLLATLQSLGVMTSYSRPSVSNDNPYSESLFKTAKYNKLYPEKPFASIDEVRSWAARFNDWYNNDHCHSGLKFITPEQRHSGQSDTIFSKRTEVYMQARLRNPSRWSKKIRNWDLPEYVILNPSSQGKIENNIKGQNMHNRLN